MLDMLITILIIGGLILAIWAKMSGQTIGELLRDIRDFIAEGAEGKAEEIIYYY
jgi:hypothetical protein